jgi:DNA-binding MarR family transcriptional regulator
MRVRDDDLDAITTVGEGLSDEDADIGAINGIIGFHIRLAHGACYRHFTETFTQLELTQKQVSVLWLVDDHPGISQIDLGQRLRMDRATTMTIVNRLQARHYLRREKSATDGRKQALYLDPPGQAALVEAKKAIGEHEAWVKSRFTDKEVKTLMELLARIHE